MDALLNLNTQMVGVITQLWVAVAHGRNNLIIIEDSNKEEGNGGDLGEGLLREIVEDPAPPCNGQVVNDREESPEV